MRRKRRNHSASFKARMSRAKSADAVDAPEAVLGLTGMRTRRQSHHGSTPHTAATGARQSDGRPAVGRRILVRPLPSSSIRYRLGVWDMIY